VGTTDTRVSANCPTIFIRAPDVSLEEVRPVGETRTRGVTEETEQTNQGRRRPDRRPDAPETAAANRPMSVEEIQSAYAEYADWMDRFDWFDRLVTGRYRRSRFRSANGRVLDVACGTGTNFPYLPDSVELVGIDVSPAMLEKARERLERLGMGGRLVQMDAQSLEFPDDSFDTVVSALSTCTFPDPVAALREMSRVCKPEGKILLVEHGKSDVDAIARFQEWRSDAHYAQAGCRWTQEPLEHAFEAELRVVRVDTGLLGMVTTLEAHPARD
jgi:ubiquinone/menaquinone biosynthesis C-methylase UbiE